VYFLLMKKEIYRRSLFPQQPQQLIIAFAFIFHCVKRSFRFVYLFCFT